MKKFSPIPESIQDITLGQFIALMDFKGELIAELIELWSGLDFDLCLNYVESNDMSWIDGEKIVEQIAVGQAKDTVIIHGKELVVKKDLFDEWFGLKMIASGLLSANEESPIKAIASILATYFCADVYGEFSQNNADELTQIITDSPAIDIYPVGIHYIELVSKMNHYQQAALTIDEAYQTQQGREKRNLMQSFGVDRLASFGDMNLIDDFCTTFTAYKHDEVFKLEFQFVIDRLKRVEIINNLTEQLTQHYHDKAKK